MNLTDILIGSASGGALGIIGGVASGLLNFFQKRQDNKFELEKLSLRSNLQQGELAGELAKAREQGAADAFTASIKADTALRGEHKWVTSFRAFTRPGLTWYFVLLMTGILAGYIAGVIALDTIDDPILQYGVVTVFNTTVMMISWWFGQRQIEKSGISWGNKSTGAALQSK
jgi:hypothetical protein